MLSIKTSKAKKKTARTVHQNAGSLVRLRQGANMSDFWTVGKEEQGYLSQ